MNPEKQDRFVRALEAQGRAEQGVAPDYGDVADALPGVPMVAELPEGSRTDALLQTLTPEVPHDEVTGEVIDQPTAKAQRQPGED